MPSLESNEEKRSGLQVDSSFDAEGILAFRIDKDGILWSYTGLDRWAVRELIDHLEDCLSVPNAEPSQSSIANLG